jgi:hypothetical protein
LDGALSFQDGTGRVKNLGSPSGWLKMNTYPAFLRKLNVTFEKAPIIKLQS